MNNLQPSQNPIDDLDERLAAAVSGESFVHKIQRKKKIKPKVDDLSFEAELEKNWWIYVLLMISAIFTGTLGFFMGLAPYSTADGIYFQTDGVHIVLAIAYVFAFIGVTEFAFGLGKWLFFTREQDNKAQSISMIIWMCAAGISILFTGWAGGSVIASFISFLTEFSNVNTFSQEWVVKAIPTLFFFYTILGAVYILSSRENMAKRMVKEQEREAELAHSTRQKITTQWGKEQVQRAVLMQYIKAVEQGVLSMDEAKEGIDAGLSLRELEKKLRRDIDGDGLVGPTDDDMKKIKRENHRHPQPQMASETDFIDPPQ